MLGWSPPKGPGRQTGIWFWREGLQAALSVADMVKWRAYLGGTAQHEFLHS